MDEQQVASPLPESQPPAQDSAHSGAPEGQQSPSVPADTGGQSADEGQEGQEGRPQPTVQDRINELTRNRRVAERVAAEAIAESQRQAQALAQMQAYIEGLQRGQVPAGGAPQSGTQRDGPPDPTQYNDWAAYTRDLARYEASQVMRQSQEAEVQAAREQQQRQAQAMAQHAHRVREATINAAAEQGVEKYPDFAKVITNPALPRLRDAHPAVVDALAYSENATDLMYYFGKNPAEAQRVMALHPTLAIRELGKLEAKLASGTVQLSNAAPPIERVRGGSNAPDPLSDRSSIDTWMKARNRQVQGKR